MFSPSESKVVTWIGEDLKVGTGWESGLVQLWESQTGKPLIPPIRHDKKKIEGVVFSEDEHWLVTWGENLARVWDATTGLPLSPWLMYEHTLKALALSDNDRYLLARTQNAVFRRRVRANDDRPVGKSSLVIEMRTGTRLNELGELMSLSVGEWQSLNQSQDEPLSAFESQQINP